MTEKGIVAVVDDDDSTLRALVRVLLAAGVEAHGFLSAEEFLQSPQVERTLCIVSDLWMPEINGLHLQRLMNVRKPHVQLVFLTGHADVSSSVRALKSGAIDFLEKPVHSVQLLEAVTQGLQRSRAALEKSIELDDLGTRYAALTIRERQVFALVSAGLLNKQIGAELGAAEKTIKQHRGVVMHKMRADSVADLVLMAATLGVRPSRADFAKSKGIFRAGESSSIS